MKNQLTCLAAWLILFATLGGCTAYTDAQLALIDQSQKGISLARDAQTGQARNADQLYALQRRRLDEAFDRDARETSDLTPDWVTEARRAYVTGVDALHTQHNEARDAFKVANENLDAIEQALTRLRYLTALPQTLMTKEDHK